LNVGSNVIKYINSSFAELRKSRFPSLSCKSRSA